MAEPTPPVTADRTSELLVYRPLSGLAIVGLACAAGYAALVVLSLILMLTRREPLFLGFWLLMLPIAGAVLCALALRQIRNSEDTRAGAALARWGLWIAVISGLGYGTFFVFTGLAIKQQANRFLLEKGPDAGFFPRLIEGDLNGAFLLTLTPSERQGLTPADQAGIEKRFDLPLSGKTPKGRLTLFRENELIRMLRQPAEPPITVEPLGVRSWAYESRGYKVERTYRITTPEAVFDVLLPVQSVDTDVPGEGRKWVLLWGPMDSLPTPRLTDFGQRMTSFRFTGMQFANGFLTRLHQRDPLGAYLDTLPAADRRTGFVRALAAAWPSLPGRLGIPAISLAAATYPDEFRRFWLPESAKLDLGAQAVARLTPPPGKLGERLREKLASMFGPNAPQDFTFQIPNESGRLAPWHKEQGKLRITYPLEGTVPMPDGTIPPPSVLVIGKIVVETDESSEPGRAQWRVVGVDFERGLKITFDGPGG
jgi:hypothetical protein